MGYGYQFFSRTKLADLAKEYAPNNSDTEYQLAIATQAWNDHKTAQENFIDFLLKNDERKTNEQ